MKSVAFAHALALAISLPALPAAAQPAAPPLTIQTGDDLGRACANPKGAVPTAAEHDRLLLCAGYIRGYLGYYGTLRSLKQAQTFCLPAQGVAAETLRVLYVTVLSKRPQLRDYPAAIDLASVLRAAYPCAAPAGQTP